MARGSRPWRACEAKLCLQQNLKYTLLSAQSFSMRDDGAWMVIASHSKPPAKGPFWFSLTVGNAGPCRSVAGLGQRDGRY